VRVCLCPSTTICLPARSRAAACCSSLSVDVPSPLQAPVDSWSTRLLLQFSCCFFQPALPLPLPARLRHCLALPGFCWIAPAAPENPLSHHRIPTGTPAPSQSVSQVTLSRTTTVCLLLDQAATSAPPPRQSHQLAQALISPTCCRLIFCSLAAAACDLLDLAASATVSAPSPCDAAANNNATASEQPFACGRPIHLATSSPNRRADYCSSLA